MTTYYRIDTAARVELTPEQFGALQANGKAAALMRLWIATVPPAPSATQRVIELPPVVDATTATQAWQVVNKTQAELDADANAADAPNIKGPAVVAALTNRITLDRSGLTAAQKIAQVESDVVMLLKIARYFVRQQP